MVLEGLHERARRMVARALSAGIELSWCDVCRKVMPADPACPECGARTERIRDEAARSNVTGPKNYGFR
jgi:hypothetical protein